MTDNVETSPTGPTLLERLDEVVAVLTDGSPGTRAVMLTGAPGAGKTTAMRELAKRLSGRSGRVRRVGVPDSGRARPFGVAAALIGIDAEFPPPDGYADHLVERVELACSDGPLVLAVDDLHHADPDSLRVLDALVGATSDLPMCLVLARRPLPIRPTLAALAARPDVRTVELPGLDDDEVTTLVRTRHGLGLGRSLRALLAAAGGNPVHIGALLDGLEQRGRIVADFRVGTVDLDDSNLVPARGTRPGLASSVGPGSGGPDDIRAAVEAATTGLRAAPAQAADLLTSVAGRAQNPADRDAVALARARALAGAGQTTEAARVARERLADTDDDAARALLLRVELHATLTTADTAGVLAILRDARALPLGTTTRAAMDRLEHLTTVIAGRDDLDDYPEGPSEIARALALHARGRCTEALALSDNADPDSASSEIWNDLSSATLWPALFALYADGPARARERSIAARRESQERGRTWLTPGLLFIAATIDALEGRWDDALAQSSAGLEAAAASGSGWVSSALGQAMSLRIRRGDLDAAGTELTRWRSRGLPDQFGLPHVDAAEVLLHEANGRLDEAASLAARIWTDTLESGRQLWALLAGPDTARVARSARDDSLLARVLADTRALPREQVRTLAPTVDLVRAIAEDDPDLAAAAATAFAARGNVVGELGAWEEAAVGAAARGDHIRAREHSTRCAAVAARLGARTVERRLAARLRMHDIRTAPPRTAGRPTTGWASLTPTELEVADFVGQGMTSPQIARRMFLSPRTVQTHVSHALAKLGQRTRSELAATVIRHNR